MLDNERPLNESSGSREGFLASVALAAIPNMDPVALRDACILAIDHGTKRIGLAIKPPGEMIVLPLPVESAQPPDVAMESLHAVIRERKVTVVVTGLPLHRDEEQAALVKRFTRRLRRDVRGVRWRFIDETLTSMEAEERLREVANSARERGKDVDSLAAAILLETYLQAQNEVMGEHES